MAFGTLFTEQHLLNPGQHQGHYPETLPKCMQKPRSTPVLFLCCWHLRKTWCPLTLVTFFWIFFLRKALHLSTLFPTFFISHVV